DRGQDQQLLQPLGRRLLNLLLRRRKAGSLRRLMFKSAARETTASPVIKRRPGAAPIRPRPNLLVWSQVALFPIGADRSGTREDLSLRRIRPRWIQSLLASRLAFQHLARPRCLRNPSFLRRSHLCRPAPPPATVLASQSSASGTAICVLSRHHLVSPSL